MNKKLLISLLFILLTGWIAACAYWSVFKINRITDDSILKNYESASLIKKEKSQDNSELQIVSEKESIEIDETVEIESIIDPTLKRSVKGKQIMYYPSNHFEIKSTFTLEKYFNNLKDYFDQNPEGLIQITGFTNKTGESSLSKGNAEKVKKYLISEYEMNPRNFRVKGKNDSKSDIESGKAKNNRIEFSFIK